jgi:hypothetical protein
MSEEAVTLRDRAEHYRELLRSPITDSLAIHAMNAMVEDLEKQAVNVRNQRTKMFIAIRVAECADWGGT